MKLRRTPYLQGNDRRFQALFLILEEYSWLRSLQIHCKILVVPF